MTDVYEDRRGKTVPVMKPESGSTYELGVTTASASVAVTHDIVTLYATQACYVKLGVTTATASGADYNFFLPANTTRSIEMESVDTIAAIRLDTDGVLYINGEA